MAAATTFPAAAPPGGFQLRWWHWGLGFIGLLALLVTVALQALDPWLRQTLEKQVVTQSGGRYELRVGTLHTRLLTGTLQLRGLRLRTRGPALDSASARLPTVRLDLARLDVTGAGLWQVLWQQTLPVDRIAVDSLAIRVSSPLPASQKPALPLHQQLPFGLLSVRIAYVKVRRVQATYRLQARDSIYLRRGELHLRDLLISQAGAADSQRIGYAAELAVRMEGGQMVAFKHRIAFGNLQFSFQQQRLRLDSLAVHSLQPVNDQRTRVARLQFWLPHLLAAGVQLEHLATRKVHLDTLRVTGPRISLTAPTVTPEPLHQLLKPWLQELTVNHFVLTRGALYIRGFKQRPSVRDIMLRGTDVRINSTSVGKPDRLYYARNWQLHTGAMSSLLDGSLYRMAYKQLNLETKTRELAVTGLLIRPALSPGALNSRTGYDTPHISTSLASVALHGCDFAALVRRKQLLLRELVVRGWRMSIQTDSRFPQSPTRSLITPEMLGNLPFRLDIRRVLLRQGTLYVETRVPKNPNPGRLTLNQFAVTLTNVTNDPRRMSAARPARGEASAWLQNQCPVEVKLVANLLDQRGHHHVTGRFGAAPLTILNPMVREVTPLTIRKGQVQDIRFALTLNRQRGWGTVWAQYSDLKVTLLTKRSPKRKTLFTRIGTSLLNGIVVRDNNPRRGKLMPGKALTTRDLRSSVFTLWQHSLLVGLLHSVGVPAKLAQGLIEDE
jgi:hypothetical protein